MPEPFHVEPDPMMRQSNRLLDATFDSQAAHTKHHDDLEAAAPGMFGQAKAAIEAAHAALVDQSRVLHHQLGEHGRGMQEFTGQVVEQDDQSGNNFRRLGGQ